MKLMSQNGACRLWVGTSGYSYNEWIDAGFYPPGTPAAKMLSVYAGTFPVTELNYTWYQMPKADSIARMGRLVEQDFRFAVKLTRTLTHEVNPDGWRGQAALFREGIRPLLQNHQLLAVLIQLPPSFDRSSGNRRYLAELLDELAGLPLAVEFRHASWVAERVFTELERRRVTLVAVDEPNLAHLFPPLDVVTNSELIYIRFHGRNARGWRSGNMQQQFDYDYTEDELGEWVRVRIPKMMNQARTGVLFFNNHVRGQAPKNARMLVEQLTGYGWGM